MKNNEAVLTIAISTCGNDLSNLKDKVYSYIDLLPESVVFMIVNQVGHNNVDFLSDRLYVINSDSIGLSQNRNICIENCKTKWIWFQDDDIELEIDNFNFLLQEINSSKSDVVTIKIGSLEDKNKYYKNYKKLDMNFPLNSLKVSSIEIIANLKSIKDLRFDENLGLGTKLPCCEENLFILTVSRIGLSIRQIDLVMCYHTTLDDNRVKKSKSHFNARGYLLAHYKFIYAFFLMLRWSLREIGDFGFFKSMSYIIKGYLEKKF
ncbi:glycosyltransferase [Vibrio diabolicus]|uniref:glycosyltransferase n=1 Tax=Vibrio diabolicus TaxID=50719 RepID=UPI003750865A